MPKKSIPTDLLQQAVDVQDAWSRINAKMTFGNVNLGALIADIDALRAVEADLVGLSNQVSALRNQRDDLRKSTWEKLKRTRSAIRGIFGDDSSEYDLVGGTRMSERKSPRRTPPPVN